MNRATQRAVVTFLAIVAIVLAIALYGYFSGAWDQPAPTQ